jgi:Bacitracin resistance protein BacA
VITYFQAIVIGLLQGVIELFSVSSLGHSVLVPASFGRDNLVKAQSAQESFYLAFVVALPVATAIARLIYFDKVRYRQSRSWRCVVLIGDVKPGAIAESAVGVPGIRLLGNSSFGCRHPGVLLFVPPRGMMSALFVTAVALGLRAA